MAWRRWRQCTLRATWCPGESMRRHSNKVYDTSDIHFIQGRQPLRTVDGEICWDVAASGHHGSH